MEYCIAETKYGKLKGKFENDLCTFLNVPYGKYERFLPAVEPDIWTGERDATEYGHVQPQSTPDLLWVGYNEMEYTEKKGLNLNIWTPGCDDQERPVIVWIHGGGNLEGTNSNPCWDGAHLVGGHDVVMVSISYRLGFLGNLYLADLLGEKYAASGSLIDLDKIMALKWIRENIRNFGGDPNNVTIMGQSGGAKSVGCLIVSPLAKGLFQKAIMVSGCAHCIHDLKTAKIITRNFLDVCGLKESEADKLLTMPVEDILRHQASYRKRFPNMFGPVIDDVVYTMRPEDYIASGACDDLTILMGYTKEEVGGHWTTQSINPEQRREVIRKRYGKNAPHVLDIYNEALKDNPEYGAFREVGNRFCYATQSVQFAQMLSSRGIKTWVYRWDFQGSDGPIHLSDLSYIFRTTEEDDPYWCHSHKYDGMSVLMNDTWMSFVKNGDPNNSRIPGWPPYTSPDNGKRMYFGQICTVEPFDLNHYDHDFDFMEFQL